MTHKDYTDDDNPQPLAPEERPRVAARAPIGRDFLDDDVLPSRSEPALRSRHAPLGRDFLDREPQPPSPSDNLSGSEASYTPAGTRTRRASPPPPEHNPSSDRSKSGNPPSDNPPSGKRPFVAAISAVVAICALGAVGGWLWHSGMLGLGSKPAASQAEPIKNAFYDQIQQAGAKNCSRVFPALGQMATLGSSYALQSSWNQDAPGSHSIFAVSGLAYDRPDFKGSGAALVFASPVGTRCEGAAMRVLTLPMACSEVSASRLPAGATRSGDLSDVPLYELANGAGKLMLVPATETACTVVTVMLAED